MTLLKKHVAFFVFVISFWFKIFVKLNAIVSFIESSYINFAQKIIIIYISSEGLGNHLQYLLSLVAYLKNFFWHLLSLNP